MNQPGKRSSFRPIIIEVTGKRIERALVMTDFTLVEAADRFQRILEAAGISSRLDELGIQPGDFVHIADAELIWEQDLIEGSRSNACQCAAGRRAGSAPKIGCARWRKTTDSLARSPSIAVISCQRRQSRYCSRRFSVASAPAAAANRSSDCPIILLTSDAGRSAPQKMHPRRQSDRRVDELALRHVDQLIVVAASSYRW